MTSVLGKRVNRDEDKAPISKSENKLDQKTKDTVPLIDITFDDNVPLSVEKRTLAVNQLKSKIIAAAVRLQKNVAFVDQKDSGGSSSSSINYTIRFVTAPRRLDSNGRETFVHILSAPVTPDLTSYWSVPVVSPPDQTLNEQQLQNIVFTVMRGITSPPYFRLCVYRRDIEVLIGVKDYFRTAKAIEKFTATVQATSDQLNRLLDPTLSVEEKQNLNAALYSKPRSKLITDETDDDDYLTKADLTSFYDEFQRRFATGKNVPRKKFGDERALKIKFEFIENSVDPVINSSVDIPSRIFYPFNDASPFPFTGAFKVNNVAVVRGLGENDAERQSLKAPHMLPLMIGSDSLKPFNLETFFDCVTALLTVQVDQFFDDLDSDLVEACYLQPDVKRARA